MTVLLQIYTHAMCVQIWRNSCICWFCNAFLTKHNHWRV